MSKRDQGASVQSYIDEGYVPEAVANYLCLLGWSPKDNREKLSLDEVASLFELDKVNRRNAAFDPDKCFWLNGQYIAADALERFRELCLPVLDGGGAAGRRLLQRLSGRRAGLGEREDQAAQGCARVVGVFLHRRFPVRRGSR